MMIAILHYSYACVTHVIIYEISIEIDTASCRFHFFMTEFIPESGHMIFGLSYFRVVIRCIECPTFRFKRWAPYAEKLFLYLGMGGVSGLAKPWIELHLNARLGNMLRRHIGM